jgi:hypothetical protein
LPKTKPAPSMWEMFGPKLHDMTGNNPAAWHSCVEALTRAGKRVKYQGPPLPPLPGGREGMLATDGVYAMVLGFAIECALKGLWVQAGNKIVESGKYIGVAGTGDHELGQLARVVLPAAGLKKANATEINVLDRLSAFVLFAGRYPIPLNAEQMKPIRVPGRGKQVRHVFLSADFELAERLLNRFTRALNPFLTPLERTHV